MEKEEHRLYPEQTSTHTPLPRAQRASGWSMLGMLKKSEKGSRAAARERVVPRWAASGQITQGLCRL